LRTANEGSLSKKAWGGKPRKKKNLALRDSKKKGLGLRSYGSPQQNCAGGVFSRLDLGGEEQMGKTSQFK